MPISKGGTKSLKTQKFGSSVKTTKPKKKEEPKKKAATTSKPQSRKLKAADRKLKKVRATREDAIKNTKSGTKERYSKDRKANRKDLAQEKKRLKDAGKWNREERKDNAGRRKEGKARGLRERAARESGSKENRLNRRAARKEAAAKKKDAKAAFGKGKKSRKVGAAERKLSRAQELRKKAEKATGRRKRRLERRAARKERKAKRKYRQAGTTREQAMSKMYDSKTGRAQDRKKLLGDKAARVGYGYKTGVEDAEGASKGFYMSRGGKDQAEQNKKMFNVERQDAWDKKQRGRLERGENLWEGKENNKLFTESKNSQDYAGQIASKQIENNFKPPTWTDFFSKGGGFAAQALGNTPDRSSLNRNATDAWMKKKGY